jgi:hypothetical protein
MRRFGRVLIVTTAALSLGLAGAGAASASADRLDQGTNSAATAIKALTASPADVTEGCGIIAGLAESTPTYSYASPYTYMQGNTLEYAEALGFDPPAADVSAQYCNVNIQNGGRFEMQWGGPSGVAEPGSCLAVDTAVPDPTYPDGPHYIVALDTPSACAQDGGQGYAWDQWTAKAVGEKDGFNAWEFTNVFNGDCIYSDPQYGAVAIYATCESADQFEWFAWNGSNV